MCSSCCYRLGLLNCLLCVLPPRAVCLKVLHGRVNCQPVRVMSGRKKKSGARLLNRSKRLSARGSIISLSTAHCFFAC